MNIHDRRVNILLILALIQLVLPARVFAADRLYFAAMVEEDAVSGDPQVLLEWGSLEGNIPAEITGFRIYRQIDSGPFGLLAEIDFTLAAPEEIRSIILTDSDADRRADLIEVLNDVSSAQTPAGPIVTEANFHTFLHDLLDPGSATFNALQRMMLIRYHPGVARAAGLAYLDLDVAPTSKYDYMLTAIIDYKSESLPIGRSASVLPEQATRLPSPTGLRQVRVAQCSAIRKNLDDLRIHFDWDVPTSPQDIGLKVLTYGYDLFWSAEDLGALDPGQGIPAGLHRVNTKPIVVAGPPPEEGPDAYLARDGGETHAEGPAWQRGRTYYYYLASRDLAGHYSMADGPLAATVVDTQPPAAPWRLHSEELSRIIEGAATPRLALVWDQINPVNYIRYFGTDRAICSADETRVCTAATDAACDAGSGIICTDLDVIRYHIFRFSSPADAAAWGTDSDGDMWPDNLEQEAASDPCDPADRPHDSAPAKLVASIDQHDIRHHRQLADMHLQMFYVDSEIDAADYDRVFYYRVLAEDRAGNVSPLSPPIRAVLYDRTQPPVAASMMTLYCDNYQARQEMTDIYRTPDDILTLVDTTGKAERYVFRRLCEGGPSQGVDSEPVASGYLEDGIAHITPSMLIDGACEATSCGEGFIAGYEALFTDNRNLPLAKTEIDLSGSAVCDAYNGAVLLEGLCFWTETRPGTVAQGPVQVCAGLAEGETARVYSETGGEMSAIATITYDPDPENNDQSCIELADLGGLVTADLCLGVRVFSENHVGSGMHYFNCVEMMPLSGAGPPAPIVEGLYSKEDAHGEPYFALRWSSPAEGQAAFVISLESGTVTRYRTVFPGSPDDSGQFSAALSLAPEDLDRQWCARVRVIDTAMQTSPWSQESCATWTSAEPDNLGWPRMREPVEAGSVTAFFMNETPGGGRPALVLSEDLSALLAFIPCDEQSSCLSKVPVCDGSDVCIKRITLDDQLIDEPVSFKNLQACLSLEPSVGTRNFVLYRQEEGRDFVQVSPLVENFTCYRYQYFDSSQQTWTFYYQVRDPFYFLRHFEPEAVGGVDGTTGAAIDPALAGGTRMIFLDRYPYRPGSIVRYKLVHFDPDSGEPTTIRTSNWLTLP